MVNEITKYQLNKIDVRLSRFIWFFYFIQTLNVVIKLIFPLSEYIWKLQSNLFMILIAILLIFTIKHVLKRVFVIFVFSEMFFVSLFLLSILQGNAALSDVLNYGFWTLFVCIPISMYFFAIEDKHVFYNEAIQFSRVILIIGSLGFIKMNSEVEYSMSLSYSLLIPLLIQINELAKEFNITNFLFTIIPLSLFILFGARGPLINIFYFVLILLLRFKDTIQFKKIIYFILALILSITLVVNFNFILLHLSNFLNSHGIYSRTIYKIIYGNFSDSSGRDQLFKYYINLAKDRPILGWGLLGGWIRNTGPHNTIIELLLSFGYIIGSILSVFVILAVLRPLWRKKADENNLYEIYASANFTMLFVSGDFLSKYNFFILIFFFLKYALKKDIRKGVDNEFNEIVA